MLGLLLAAVPCCGAAPERGEGETEACEVEDAVGGPGGNGEEG